MELFVKIVNGLKLLTSFVKSNILAPWQGSEYNEIQQNTVKLYIQV